MTKFRLAPNNSQFHGAADTAATKAAKAVQKGERLESIGNGRANLYIDGKFIAIVSED